MQKRYNHAGKQFIADEFIKTRGGGSSASLTKVQTVLGTASNSKQIDELADKLKYITSDGIITMQEKKTLLREHSILYSAYLSVGNQMEDAGYTVNDNNLYLELVTKNRELKAIMDEIDNTEGDYEVKPTDNIDVRFTECWQAVNNCEYFLSQNKNFASRYSLQVDSISTELDGPVSFYANVYEGNVIQTDLEFNIDSEFTWTREQIGFTKREGKKLTLYPSDIAGTESKFYCQWRHRMNTAEGTTPLYSTFVVPFIVRIAGIVEYVWSTKSEGLDMDAETWTRGHVPTKPATPPAYYLWQRTSKDNGETWELARSNAQPEPEDKDLRSFDIAGAIRDFKRSSRGYVYFNQSLIFSIVKKNLSGTPTWSIEPENDNLLLTDNGDGTATVTVKRGYEFGFFKIKAKLSDSDITRTLSIDSVKPAPKRHNFKSRTELPSNDTSNPDYPFIVPDEGPIMKYDYCTWVHSKGKEDVNEVMFYNDVIDPLTKTYWTNIDKMPENLRGETSLDSLPSIMKNPNIPVEGKFINVFCESIISNYIASNKIDSREYHVIDNEYGNGIIYGGDCRLDSVGNPILGDSEDGFYIKSNGSTKINGLIANRLTVNKESTFMGTISSSVLSTQLTTSVGDTIVIDGSCIVRDYFHEIDYFKEIEKVYPWSDGAEFQIKAWFGRYGQSKGYVAYKLKCTTMSDGAKAYNFINKQWFGSYTDIVTNRESGYSNTKFVWYPENPKGVLPPSQHIYGYIYKVLVNGQDAKDYPFSKLVRSTTVTLNGYADIGPFLYIEVKNGVAYFYYNEHIMGLQSNTDSPYKDISFKQTISVREAGVYTKDIYPEGPGRSIGSATKPYGKVIANTFIGRLYGPVNSFDEKHDVWGAVFN